MEKVVSDLNEFNIKIYINKLRDSGIERLILNHHLNDLIIKYKYLDIKSTQVENLAISRTITQDQANKIKDIIHRAEVTKKADFNNVETMTDQGHKVYMDSNNCINSLKLLTENGNINHDQAKKIIMRQIYLYNTRSKDKDIITKRSIGV